MRVLIVHGLRFDSRLTNVLHSTSFLRHLGGCEVFCANVYGPGLVSDQGSFDVGIVTYEVLALRSSPEWPTIVGRLREYFEACETRIAFPQDDYSFSDRLDRLFIEVGIRMVWSPIAQNLEFLYPRSLRSGVKFYECLTGYWESDLTQAAESLIQDFESRPRDIGSRVRELAPYLGTKAQRKSLLARSFAQAASKEGFVCDVGTSDAQSFAGFSWWRFLAGCRFTVGRRGGASLVDPKGKFQRRYGWVQAIIPNFESSMTLPLTGISRLTERDFSAISPRLFEAAALHVCQVLEEDTYVGGLEPWVHYIPLRADLGNTREVFEAMRDFEFCKEVADACRSNLILSDELSYFEFFASFARILGLGSLTSLPRPRVIDLDHGISCSTAEEYGSVSQAAKEMILRRTSPTLNLDKVSAWVDLVKSGEMPLEALKRPWCSASVAKSTTNLS